MKNSTTHQLRRRIAAVPEMHALLRAHYAALELDEGTAFCLDLAAEEIFTNMVRHNPSGREFLTMNVKIGGGIAHLQWIDHEVPPFDATARAPVDVTRPVHERQPGGLGLHLTRSVVDSLTYTYKDGDMHVEVVKKLGA